jgi:hypothetical protein
MSPHISTLLAEDQESERLASVLGAISSHAQKMFELLTLSLGLVSAATSSAAAVTGASGTADASGQLIQPSTYTAPGRFPTSVYKTYYGSPTATSAQVQPVISDPVSVSIVGTVLSHDELITTYTA